MKGREIGKFHLHIFLEIQQIRYQNLHLIWFSFQHCDAVWDDANANRNNFAVESFQIFTMRTNTDSNDIWIVTDCIVAKRLCLFEDRTNLNALPKCELISMDFELCRRYLRMCVDHFSFC